MFRCIRVGYPRCMGEFVSARVTTCAGVYGQAIRLAGGPPMLARSNRNLSDTSRNGNIVELGLLMRFWSDNGP
jgi:hypothetical protein